MTISNHQNPRPGPFPTPLLRVDTLDVVYPARAGAPAHPAVQGVSFTLPAGRTLGLVGESGSGKTTIGRAVLGLVRPSAGSITINSAPHDRRAGPTAVQAVFQHPLSSLHPLRTIGASLAEPLRIAGHDRDVTAAWVEELLGLVGLDSAVLTRRPAGLSGGQLQRVALARALALDARLIVCDEVTSALDVSTRASVIDVLLDVQERTGVSYLFIGHDLPLVAHVSDHVLVLQNGRVVDDGDPSVIVDHPGHEYTANLIAASPLPDPARQRARRAEREGARHTKDDAPC